MASNVLRKRLDGSSIWRRYNRGANTKDAVSMPEAYVQGVVCLWRNQEPNR